MTHIFVNLIFSIELQISMPHTFQDFLYRLTNINDPNLDSFSTYLWISLTPEYLWLTAQACKYLCIRYHILVSTLKYVSDSHLFFLQCRLLNIYDTQHRPAKYHWLMDSSYFQCRLLNICDLQRKPANTHVFEYHTFSAESWIYLTHVKCCQRMIFSRYNV